MRRAEMARRRRNLSEKRNEEVKVGVLINLMLGHFLTLHLDRWKPSTSCSRSKRPRQTGGMPSKATRHQTAKATDLAHCLSAGSAPRREAELLCRTRCLLLLLARYLLGRAERLGVLRGGRWFRRFLDFCGSMGTTILRALSRLFSSAESVSFFGWLVGWGLLVLVTMERKESIGVWGRTFYWVNWLREDVFFL